MEQGEEKSLGAQELLQLMQTQRVPHGVLLQSSQTEKQTEYANLLAMWAVCNTQTGDKPCKVCSGCTKAQSHNHSDIYTAKVSGKTEVISVEEIRNICTDAYTIPNEANIKVYILPGADKMQAAAQNAFLKILEEPPQNILFILLCQSAEKLLSTIRSRTVTFRLDHTGSEGEDEQTVLAREKAEKMALALTDSSGYPLLVETSTLSDRRFAKLVLQQFSMLIRDAMVLKAGGSGINGEHAVRLQKKIKTKNLVKLLETIQTAQQRLDRNINMNLFCAWLCSTLRRQK